MKKLLLFFRLQRYRLFSSINSINQGRPHFFSPGAGPICVLMKNLMLTRIQVLIVCVRNSYSTRWDGNALGD